ncbi:serine hydrolase domain-containing protein [Virgibacillus proomii]|uniref:serine hydrolase domain-containing protein n=1 Tax=Virgibacillus proomii TaxID=84407 RepID=UPI001C10613F|nr:serine hydrolase domain-containing protein [Virgibacillus proomii]MBU5265922.1 beta-lactamase family protein [Virgibacillus proomii]
MKMVQHNLMQEKISELLPVLMEKYNVPGMAIAIMEDGENWVKTLGFANKNTGKKVEGNTVFQVGSLSKIVTAWGILKLVEQGKIQLDQPVMNYISRWQFPRSKYSLNEVTIRRILSHTAGLSVSGYLGVHPNKKLKTLKESLSGFLGINRLKIKHEPGKNANYSGGGYTILQLLIEEVTGKTFHSFMEDEIFHPLGMRSSTFIWDQSLIGRAAVGYGRGNSKPLSNYRFIEQAAAGLRTTIFDLALFLKAHHDTAKQRIGPNVITSDSLLLMQKRIDRVIPYGLGYQIVTIPKANKVLLHGGINRGWRSRFILLPKMNTGLVVLTNSNSGEYLIREIIRVWLESKVGKLSDFNRKALNLGEVESKIIHKLLGF